ncbi:MULTISPECIES: replication initiator protein A [Rhodopseudomonas]|uniref:Replication protein A n=1 Tax=Rhodopseudomonas palustris TaxID=1076 RepID=A0A0D7F4R6_RHOPL|nr:MULTISPECIES: replication initiator protein A [Rhodopseudomonas]KIZ48124.1 replication protein A [Rhodopseudomonas palustris]MDF3810756.1 replication initiator protein A [Rhodopseudomonas sp. BAL398]WOK20559.1 replication initiator protein A [Rhodopseudomonas sp. BAL398]
MRNLDEPRRPAPCESERTRLNPFVVIGGDASPRDQRDLMERPFFSLSKSPRTKPILYRANDVEVQVFGMPKHGMATIWDADVLIWAASQIVRAENLGLTTSRFFRFTPYQLLRGVGRPTGNQQYLLLKAALARLQSTVIATTIRNGEHWRRRQFSWINEWEEMSTHSGRVEGIEFVLPDWFYNGVIDRSLVLTIDPAYFRLTGGIERWLYRVARKHAGHQRQGWVFEVAHLHAKSGSLARGSDFALDIRRIAARQPLPGYRLLIEREGRSELLRILPVDLSTVPVQNLVNRLGRSGAAVSADQAQTLSADQAHQPQLNLWLEQQNRAPNLESNIDSNSSVLYGVQVRRGAGAGFRGPVRTTIDPHPTTSTAAEEEPSQVSGGVDRAPNSKRSKR